MSIRIRVVEGKTIALCAARSIEKPGDVYLDDAQHHALTIKFSDDFASENGLPRPDGMRELVLMDREEDANPARALWNKIFSSKAVSGESASERQEFAGLPSNNTAVTEGGATAIPSQCRPDPDTAIPIAPPPPAEKCPTCEGVGRRCYHESQLTEVWGTCDACNGTGERKDVGK